MLKHLLDNNFSIYDFFLWFNFSNTSIFAVWTLQSHPKHTYLRMSILTGKKKALTSAHLTWVILLDISEHIGQLCFAEQTWAEKSWLADKIKSNSIAISYCHTILRWNKAKMQFKPKVVTIQHIHMPAYKSYAESVFKCPYIAVTE